MKFIKSLLLFIIKLHQDFAVYFMKCGFFHDVTCSIYVSLVGGHAKLYFDNQCRELFCWVLQLFIYNFKFLFIFSTEIIYA